MNTPTSIPHESGELPYPDFIHCIENAMIGAQEMVKMLVREVGDLTTGLSDDLLNIPCCYYRNTEKVEYLHDYLTIVTNFPHFHEEVLNIIKVLRELKDLASKKESWSAEDRSIWMNKAQELDSRFNELWVKQKKLKKAL